MYNKIHKNEYDLHDGIVAITIKYLSMERKKDSKNREYSLALGLRTNFWKQTEQMYAWVPFITRIVMQLC